MSLRVGSFYFFLLYQIFFPEGDGTWRGFLWGRGGKLDEWGKDGRKSSTHHPFWAGKRLVISSPRPPPLSSTLTLRGVYAKNLLSVYIWERNDVVCVFYSLHKTEKNFFLSLPKNGDRKWRQCLATITHASANFGTPHLLLRWIRKIIDMCSSFYSKYITMKDIFFVSWISSINL